MTTAPFRLAAVLAIVVAAGCSPPSHDGPTPVPSGSLKSTAPAARTPLPGGYQPEVGPTRAPAEPLAAALSRFEHTDGPAKGLVVEILEEGSGDPVVKGMNLRIHYTGWLDAGGWTRGRQFDSSRTRGVPFPTPNIGGPGLIDGWRLGIPTTGECAGMKLHEKRRLLIPWSLGYGTEGYPGLIPSKANLIFEVELVEIGS